MFPNLNKKLFFPILFIISFGFFANIVYAQPSSTQQQDRSLNNQIIDKFFDDMEWWMQRRDLIFESFFQDPFFQDDKEFFDHVKQSQKVMNELYKQTLKNSMNQNSIQQKSVDITTNIKNFGVRGIYQEEKGDNLLYHIKIPELDQANVNIKVDGEYLTIEGKDEGHQQKNQQFKQGTAFSQNTYSSQFYQRFPLPYSVNPGAVRYLKKKDEIVVVIPKR